MMTGSENICRLCFGVGSNFETLGTYEDKIRTISLDLDVTLTNQPLICPKCTDVLLHLFNFNTTCLKNKYYLKTSEEHIQRNTYKNEIKEERICRLCLKYLNNTAVAKLNDIEEDEFLGVILKKCLPEIEFGITNQRPLCFDCMDNLQNQYNFLTACLANEETIKRYILANSMFNREVDLCDVKFVDNMKNYCKIDSNFIKFEHIEENESPSCNIVVKTEEPAQVKNDELHIKGEENLLSVAENENEFEKKSIQVEAAAKIFQCTSCPYAAGQKAHLTQHVIAVHKKGNAGIFHCEKCEYTSYNIGNLNRHLRKHKDTKSAPFKCEICPKVYYTNIELDGHILKNHKEGHGLIKSKIYRCKLCTYNSVNQGHLYRHINHIHKKTVDKKYYCNKCGYCCLRTNFLARHLQTHSTEKPISCSDCRKRFYSKHDLHAHFVWGCAENKEKKTGPAKDNCGVVGSSTTICIGDLKKRMRAKLEKIEDT